MGHVSQPSSQAERAQACGAPACTSSQISVPPVISRQLFPHSPQLLLLTSSRSQPLLGSPSQSPQPNSQAKISQVATSPSTPQTADATCGKLLQSLPHSPQCASV